jgi:serine protease AprX
LIGAVVVALFLAMTPLAAESKSGPSKIDPALLAAATARPNELFPVIVRGAPSALAPLNTVVPAPGRNTQGRDENAARVKKAESALSASTADGARRSLAIVGGASGALSGSQIVALSREALVDRVIQDQTFTATWKGDNVDSSDDTNDAEAVREPAIEAVNAPKVWESKGLSGNGIAVAVIDSGVADHPDLAGRIVARVDMTGEGSQGDPGGHGTYVAGLIAGNGAASNGAYTGVAPKANIASVRVIDATGHAKLSTIFAGLQWVLANRTTYNIRIANLSFGATALTGYQNDLLASAVEMLNFAGLTVVVSAGNQGAGQSTITTPATDPFVLTVGADDDHNTASLRDDSVAKWSSRGPTAFDGIAKPDLIAPGRKVVGLRVAGSTIDTLNTDRRVKAKGQKTAQYFTMSGTSVAAPIVAGVAALYLEKHPAATPREVKSQLTATARPIGGARVMDQGAGVVDAYAAVTKSPVAAPFSKYPASGAFAEQVFAMLYGQPLVWRDPSFNGGVDSHGVPWASVTWENITWDGITWESVTWEAFDWQGITWEGLTWEDVTWDTRSGPRGARGAWELVD